MKTYCTMTATIQLFFNYALGYLFGSENEGISIHLAPYWGKLEKHALSDWWLRVATTPSYQAEFSPITDSMVGRTVRASTLSDLVICNT